MKKTYDALKALTLNFDIKVVIPKRVVSEHVCNCDKQCDGDCSCYNKTFEKIPK